MLPVPLRWMGPDVDQAAAASMPRWYALGEWVAQAAESSGLTILAWGGLLNSLLSVGLRQNLEQRGIAVLAPVRLSPGDAGIALGQAWVALDSLE